MKKGLLVLLAFCGLFYAVNGHALTAFTGDQDTVHLYPFVCAADASDAADTIGTSPCRTKAASPIRRVAA
jgi:hypothetical protein